MPYSVCKSIDIDFAHHIRGHQGACINVHGHTWKFEVTISALTLNEYGFVVDFSDLKHKVLKPVHALLDHSLAVGASTYQEIEHALASMGKTMLSTRHMGTESKLRTEAKGTLHGAKNAFPGGMKVAVLPFSPTSERLAKWLFDVASDALNTQIAQVSNARIYETLHPVESIAEYRLLD